MGLVGILQCSVVSEPMATLVLSHGGLVLASTSGKDDRGPRFIVSSAPNFLRLEIRDLGLADSGEYTCTATNSYGNTSSTLDFQATGKKAGGAGGAGGRELKEEACSGLFLLGVSRAQPRG